jgi:hypothetical protein
VPFRRAFMFPRYPKDPRPGPTQGVTAALKRGRIVDVEVYFGWSVPHEARAGGFVDES